MIHPHTTHAYQPKLVVALLFSIFMVPLAQGNELIQVDKSESVLRRPVAMARIDDTDLIVANQASGTLSIVDTERHLVAAEFELCGVPSDVIATDLGWLVTDTKLDRVVALNVSRDRAEVLWELPMPSDPVTVRWCESNQWCSVACSWSRQIVFVDLAKGVPQIADRVELPFSPRQQLVLDIADRLIVADAYGDQFAVINTNSRQVESIRSLPAHNIRGLTVSEDLSEIYITHEILNETTPPVVSEVMWGTILSDAGRAIKMETILDPQANLLSGSRLIAIGRGTQGAGDPEAVMVLPDDRLLVAVGGVSEIAIVEPDRRQVTRLPVLRRPVATARVNANRYVVANHLSDSLTVLDFSHSDEPAHPISQLSEAQDSTPPLTDSVDYGGYTPYKTVSREPLRDSRRVDLPGEPTTVTLTHFNLGPPPQLDSVARGELLFFDAKLSNGNWYSCHSCHTDGHTNGMMADTLSDGGEGAPKRILSLRGAGQTGPWAWIGDKTELKDQIHQTLRLTMQGRKLSDDQIHDLVSYIRSLPAPPPYRPTRSPEDDNLIMQGRVLFESLQCNDCHQGNTLTSTESYDVGLSDARGNDHFNPPSLLGVGHRTGLFHDKRAASLDEVVNTYRHQIPRELTSNESAALIRYLQSL
jgi:mono/diheme cytochrome c family protein/DNA-binding beta-propeller fold protein YncE